MNENEYMNEEFSRLKIHRHHRHCHEARMHLRPFPLSEEMINSASAEILFQICAHDMHMRKSNFGASQDSILRVLAKEGSMSQKDLRHRLRVAPGSMSEIISKMEEKGLLIRERSEDDRRHATIHITEEGKKAAEGLKEPESFLKALDENEKQELAVLLRKVVRANHLIAE